MTDWETRRIVKTMIPILLALSLLQMVSGTVLETFEEIYLDNPSLLVLVPVSIAMGGNLGSMFSARLSTELHLGTIELDYHDKKIRANVVAILFLAFTIFILLGIAAYVVGNISGGNLGILTVVFISVTSGMILAVIVILVSLGATYAAYHFGLDPDDTVVPIVTNVCDISGVVILTGVILVVV